MSASSSSAGDEADGGTSLERRARATPVGGSRDVGAEGAGSGRARSRWSSPASPSRSAPRPPLPGGTGALAPVSTWMARPVPARVCASRSSSCLRMAVDLLRIDGVWRSRPNDATRAAAHTDKAGARRHVESPFVEDGRLWALPFPAQSAQDGAARARISAPLRSAPPRVRVDAACVRRGSTCRPHRARLAASPSDDRQLTAALSGRRARRRRAPRAVLAPSPPTTSRRRRSRHRAAFVSSQAAAVQQRRRIGALRLVFIAAPSVGGPLVSGSRPSGSLWADARAIAAAFSHEPPPAC
jgi:hypothetical protein